MAACEAVALPQPVDSERGSETAAQARAIRLLAFVHLRNIHNSTGAGRVARQLTEHLALRPDVSLRILADRGDHQRILPQVGPPWSDFRFELFDPDTSRQQARWFLLNHPIAQSFWPEAEVVFCTAESYVPKGKARLAVTVHDAAYFEIHAHRRDRAFLTQKLKWSLLYRKLARKADLFHAVSQFSADRLAHFFPQIRSRLRVVHNAVTPHFFEPVTALGEAYLQSSGLKSKPYLLLPGGLHFRKNAELVLQAWPAIQASHPDLMLVVVNHSHPDYVTRLRSLDGNLSPGGNIMIAGFVSDDALKSLYTAAQAVWFPSRYEGFGLPVIEAMACGTPVVTSRASSLPEIGGSAALYAHAADWKSHVEAIQGVLRDSQLQANLSRQGRERALQFTWARSASQLKKHFEDLL